MTVPEEFRTLLHETRVEVSGMRRDISDLHDGLGRVVTTSAVLSTQLSHTTEALTRLTDLIGDGATSVPTLVALQDRRIDALEKIVGDGEKGIRPTISTHEQRLQDVERLMNGIKKFLFVLITGVLVELCSHWYSFSLLHTAIKHVP